MKVFHSATPRCIEVAEQKVEQRRLGEVIVAFRVTDESKDAAKFVRPDA